MQFALTYARGVFDTRDKLMGRQAAGVGFLKAALAARPERLWCYTHSRDLAQDFGSIVLGLTVNPPELRFIPADRPDRLAQAGVLYRADPMIASDAWHRQHQAHSRAYSLCGITHTLSSLGAMSTITALLTAPLYSWDAVICTSTAARDVLRVILETEMDHLRSRVGATNFTLPQMPVIPLGVHPADFEFDDATRLAARARMGIAPDDVAVLFAGRLVFHGKAHPLPMFLALEEAAAHSSASVHLVLFGQFPSEKIRSVFLAEAKAFAPSVTLQVLDGSRVEDRDAAWAGADIFTSLSDNIQETFGLTPIEAMAAGLPVVVSDWNGYKDTVRDQIDGFRIRTLAPPPGSGSDLAHRFDAMVDEYDKYIGSACQFVAVDIQAASAAYAKLIESPDLRRSMGESGRRRVAEKYDWTVVFQRYVVLWDELAERRRADVVIADEARKMRRSDRLDPFGVFQSYPTGAFDGATIVRLAAGATTSVARDRRHLDSVSYASAFLPPEVLVERIFDCLTQTRVHSLEDMASTLKDVSRISLVRAVAWLAKMGLLVVGDARSMP